MKKVLFLINTLGGGGAERVLVNLVNNMDREQYDITVRTMFQGGVNAERLLPHIRYECKNAPLFRGIAKVFCLIPAKWLYRYFVGNKHYDIVVAFMHGAPTKVVSGCTDPMVKTATWLHTGDPANSTFFKFWFRKKAAFRAYASCGAIVGISQTVADAFSEYTGIRDNVVVVYNTNDTVRIHELSKEHVQLPFEKTRPLICSVGRAVKEKGYDRLIRAAVRLREEGFDFDVVIVGNGDRFAALKEQVEAADAASFIHLLGNRDNPYPLMKAADLFICSSRQEGLSTVVAEAIILQIPVVSTRVSGAEEMLGKNNEYGLVTDNSEEGVYDGLKAMLSDRSLFDRYRVAVKERAPFFSTEHTVLQAQELLERL